MIYCLALEQLNSSVTVDNSASDDVSCRWFFVAFSVSFYCIFYVSCA